MIDNLFSIIFPISLFVAGWCFGNKLDKDRFIELQMGINNLLRELKRKKNSDIFYKTKVGDIINLSEIEAIYFNKSRNDYVIMFKSNNERGVLLDKEEYNSMIDYLDCANLGTWVFSNSGKTKIKVGE